MRRLVLLALLVAACNYPQPVTEDGPLTYAHDDTHGVSCWGWRSNAAAIHCLPDKEVQ